MVIVQMKRHERSGKSLTLPPAAFWRAPNEEDLSNHRVGGLTRFSRCRVMTGQNYRVNDSIARMGIENEHCFFGTTNTTPWKCSPSTLNFSRVGESTTLTGFTVLYRAILRVGSPTNNQTVW